MNDMPLVSILVACYNQEKFIVDCIKGMLDQTYSNFELIISDDASTDNTWENICNYKEMLEYQLSKVVLLHQDKNLGFIKNLNSMLEKATGDYVKIIAGDDFLDREYVSRLIQHAWKRKDVGVWYTNGYIVDEKTSFENIYIEKDFYEEGQDLEIGNIVEQLYKDNFIFAPSAMIKKELFDVYGQYDESLAIEDWEMWLRYSSKGVKFSYLDEKLVYYRKNSQSITSLNNTNQLENKRIQLYLSSRTIIERYRMFVSKQIWLERLVQLYIVEKKIAQRNGLTKLENIINSDILKIVSDRNINLKNKVKYLRRIMKETCKG